MYSTSKAPFSRHHICAQSFATNFQGLSAYNSAQCSKAPCVGNTGSPALKLRKPCPSLQKRVAEVIGQRSVKLEPDLHPPAPRAQVLDSAFYGEMGNESTQHPMIGQKSTGFCFVWVSLTTFTLKAQFGGDWLGK